MYKVFVNEKPLTFSEIPLEGIKNIRFEDNATFNVVVDKLENTSISALNIFHHNLQKLWSAFTNHFQYLEAAGGIVINHKKEILFIKRFNKWDLPKGKVEEGESLEETAQREIAEECGIHNTQLHEFLMTTYHIYKNKKNILKTTHWFLLSTKTNEKPIPQTEEGIEEVAWKNAKQSYKAKQNTYKNIELLLDYYASLSY